MATRRKVKNLTSRRQALAALRKLGYEKSYLQMTRNAMTYAKPDRSMMITIADHGQFIMHDRVRKPYDWNFHSMFLHVGNLRKGATSRLSEVMRQLDTLDVPRPEEMNEFDLAVAMARGEAMSRN
jgi:hypothetical protein